jgi:periplasmic divalent cation tolerance protein
LPALICFCTCPDQATALRIARTLVDERLAACANLLPAVQSVYRWQGQVEEAAEALLLIKTAPHRLDALRKRIVALHPYELPELIAVEAAAGLPAYLDWIVTETASGTEAPNR